MAPDVHPTALVAPDARLGAGVRVGPFAVIEAGVTVGAGSRIAAHAVLRSGTSIGEGNELFEGCILGAGEADSDGRLRIGSGNVVREHVTICRGSRRDAPTAIGDGCFLMAAGHISAGCRLEDGVILANSVLLEPSVALGRRAFLSGGVTVSEGCRIGALAMGGGNAAVETDVPPFAVVDGVPARIRGLNRVGLDRAGVSVDSVGTLKRALRILMKDDLSGGEQLRQLEALDSCEELADVLRFVGERTAARPQATGSVETP